ncbi:hypothetical protein [Alkalihalobacillus sp. LMS39]|uniref:hypothetical protein n=1 Tax=Alkalihalobacillus sp. LMS39 TaxID=2924032 RepID=UPI001FB409EB|nr:hypothetical protein [Alkalihalobacillus sp. LMS39]UOE92650.1 hypothetical protein MM271_15570 [Alkalihalobacillus sp. LMS39]
MNPYHCCATCKHFRVTKQHGKRIRFCQRLGYQTEPTYQFQCWDPKDQVLTLMKKRMENED